VGFCVNQTIMFLNYLVSTGQGTTKSARPKCKQCASAEFCPFLVSLCIYFRCMTHINISHVHKEGITSTFKQRTGYVSERAGCGVAEGVRRCKPRHRQRFAPGIAPTQNLYIDVNGYIHVCVCVRYTCVCMSGMSAP